MAQRDEAEMMAERKAKKEEPTTVNVVARLKAEYLDMFKRGLGRTDMSDEEERQLREELGEELDKTFRLYARVTLAEQLGVDRWLVAEMTGNMPETHP
jgi:hypothetical protein